MHSKILRLEVRRIQILLFLWIWYIEVGSDATRELPDMMSALEGRGGHGKVEVEREVA